MISVVTADDAADENPRHVYRLVDVNGAAPQDFADLRHLADHLDPAAARTSPGLGPPAPT